MHEIHIKGDFDNHKDKGYSFGASREVYRRVYTKTHPFIPDPEMPGPGTYDIKSFVEKIQTDNKSFIIGKKEAYEFPLNYPQNPGPGYYNDQTNLNSTGNYFHSKYSNSGSQKFSQNPRDFLNIKSQTPGPGSYDPKTNINLDGKYFMSNYKNSLVRKFGNGTVSYANTSIGQNSIKYSMDFSNLNDRMRTQILSIRNATPGPGSYRIISEFGKYELSQPSPALLETQSTTPVKRAFSAMGPERRKRNSSTIKSPLQDIIQEQ